jgi:hypothetical protein
MITATGYSKDPSIMPDGIVLTMPVAFFEDRKTDTVKFTKLFERYMREEDALWNYRLTNLPKLDVIYVYLIWDKKVQFRVNLVCYERNKTKSFHDAPDKKVRHFPNANWVILAGPAVRPPKDIPMKGFQGFRYCTKLF